MSTFTHKLGKSKKPSLYSKKTEIDIEEAVENISKAIQKQHGKQHQMETKNL